MRLLAKHGNRLPRDLESPARAGFRGGEIFIWCGWAVKTESCLRGRGQHTQKPFSSRAAWRDGTQSRVWDVQPVREQGMTRDELSPTELGHCKLCIPSLLKDMTIWWHKPHDILVFFHIFPTINTNIKGQHNPVRNLMTFEWIEIVSLLLHCIYWALFHPSTSKDFTTAFSIN